ncbi:MAG: hypothetical protein EA370_02840 [Wenzhouxiangella sp.]|nr:MAG: hypothetical protein EA370_02840 [Wenzhouxiangella sp.]
MDWVPFEDERGRRWEVDQLMLWMLIREYVHARNIYYRARVKVERRLFSANVTTVEVNWDGFGTAKNRDSEALYQETAEQLLASGAQGLEKVIIMRKRAREYCREFRRKQRKAQSDTMDSIDRSVRNLSAGETTARAVRDISAGTLVVGATFLTGGAAAGALGAGSVLSGTGTYQDTGNLGAAAINATGTFVVGAIGMAGTAGGGVVRGAQALPGNQQAVLLLVGMKMDVSFNVAQGLVEGKELKDVVVPALVNTTLSNLGSAGAQSVLGRVFDSSALTLCTKLTDTQRATAAIVTAGGAFAGNNASDGARAVWNRASSTTRVLADVVKAVDDDEAYVRDRVLRPA